MPRRLALVFLAAALLAAAALGACTDDDAPQAAGSTTTTVDPDASTPTFVGDGSAFCDAMLGVGQVGRDENATAAEVLADNERLVGFLDDAEAAVPADAPSGFGALLADYRTAAAAITAAAGDVPAAFAALEAEAPEVVERLGSSESHAAAFAFLVERCGITAP